MRIKTITILMLIILFQVFSKSQELYATHAAGTDLTYRCLGGNQYQVEVSFYRDCAGIPEPSVITIYYRSVSCGYNLNVTATPVANTGTEISYPCSTATTTCSGGINPGIQKFVYRAVVNLPANCSDWVFSYFLCCRNCSITTIDDPCGSSSNLYVEATLNNLTAPCNSSPVFSNNPIAFVCVGQNFNFNQGVFDADGDSLAYSLITPKTGANTTVQYLPPATQASPLASSTPFTINAITGDINFTSSQIQIGVLAVLVKEYRNGQLIGSVIRDMQVYSAACNNNLPVASGMNGTAVYSKVVCPGQQICFDIFTDDADAAQTVTTIINNSIPGSTITSTGGAHPVLTFCWTPGFNDVDLLPKTFTVTVKDDNCPVNGLQTFSYSIFVPSPFFTTATTNVSCFGGNNGSASVTPVYGNTYSYLWNTTPPQTTQSVTNLTAGTYMVTVSDSGCSLTVPVVITSPTSLTVSGNVINTACNNACSGSISTTVSGGTGLYSFQWNDGSTSSVRSGLCAGVYTVTVTDANNCSVVVPFTVGYNTGFTIVATATDVSCNNAGDGVVDLMVSGGVAPFTYIWSDGQTTEDAIALSPGTYSVIVSDFNGCTATTSVEIKQPDVLSATSTIAGLTCFESADGLIDIEVTGGTSPYFYNWSNGAITEDISGLQAGTYSVQVTDSHGCVWSQNYSVSQPDPLSVSFTSQQVTCFGGSNGSIDISVSGGNAPYNYEWSNGSFAEDIAGLASGTYMVTVSDAHQCQMISAFAISQPDELEITLMASDAICTVPNGSITSQIVGGTAPYGYQWSDGSSGSDILNAVPGIYTLTVTDVNGCQTTDTAVVGGASQLLQLSFNSVSASCSNTDDGSADLTVAGGTEPYSFNWSNGNIAEDLFLVLGGNYDVTVTDANGCTVLGSVEIESPDPLQIDFNIVPIGCGVTKGSVTANISGGTPSYTYLWSTGETTNSINNLDPGQFTLTATDLNGCQVTAVADVVAYADLVATSEAGDESLPGANDGSIDLSVSGGEAPYVFEWSNGAITEDLAGLSAGIYSVTVSDFSGCTIQLSAEVFPAITSGLQETASSANGFISYENGVVWLVLNTNGKEKSSAWVYNYAGQSIMNLSEMDLSKNKVNLSDKNLASGIYLIRLDAGSTTEVLKFSVGY